MRKQIAQFECEEWRPAKLTRRNIHQVSKLRQFEMLDELWPKMVDYMLDANAGDFRTALESASSNRSAHTGIAVSSFNEMDVVARKTDEEILGIVTCTLAYASLLRITGMRGLTGINVRLTDFTEIEEDGSVLLERFENKLGSTRNVSKPVYCRIVPCVHPRSDPLVHIARHAVKVAAAREQVFGYGFTRKDQQDDEAFAKCPQRRFIAVLHAVAIACGSSVGLGERRLHAFRVLCENRLGQLGVSSQGRSDYIGWQSTVQSQSYSLMKTKARCSAVPYVLAGRGTKDEPPHAMWGLMGDVPGAGDMSYWERVVYVAVAAKALEDASIEIDSRFQARMDEHLKTTTSANERKTNADPRTLLKRVRELERQLQSERTKRARLELEAAPAPTDDDDESSSLSSGQASVVTDPVEALTEFIKALKVHRAEGMFPKRCADSFPMLSTLVDAASTPKRSFGVPLSGKVAKDLIRLLYLVVLHKRCPSATMDGTARNWTGWVNRNKNTHPVLRGVDMKSWASFRSTSA
jgi:hypothetical protein